MVNDLVNRYLHNAVKKDQHDLVSSFLSGGGMDVNARDGYGMTALMWAAGRGYMSIASTLLENGADLEARNELLSAHSIENLETGKGGSWTSGDQLGMVYAKKHHGWTALIWAARSGQTEMVRLLLGRGADINAITKDGFTALVHAVSNKHTETAQLLFEHGADPNLTEDGVSPALPIAAGHGLTDLVRAILDRGGKIDALDDNGHNALNNAVAHNESKTLELLFEYDADLIDKCSDATERPPILYIAAAQDALECAEILLDRGADMNAKDELNRLTALEFALDELSGPRVARLLIERGADTEGALSRVEYARGTAEGDDITEADSIIALLKDRAEAAAKET